MTERLLFGHFYISAFLQHLCPTLRRLFSNCKQKVAVFNLSEYYSSANSYSPAASVFSPPGKMTFAVVLAGITILYIVLPFCLSQPHETFP